MTDVSKLQLQLKPKIQLQLKPKIQLQLTPNDLVAGPNQENNYGKILFEKGVVVVPIFNENEKIHWNTEFKTQLLQFKEYNQPTLQTIYVYGTLGCLGNPSSFHNPFVRALRMRIMSEGREIFKQAEQAKGLDSQGYRNLEQLFDRMCIRRKGTKTQAENWHRDIYSHLVPGDDIFGGWVNLDLNKSQYFSCVPETHTQTTSGSSFAKITQEDIPKYQSGKQIIEVPPGHWIVFYQQLVHEVISRKMSDDSYRTYIGFRLTHSNQPIDDHQLTIQNQGVPNFLPGGMAIKMYADLNIKFHLNQLIEWSNVFKKECLKQKTNKKSGLDYIIVEQQMKSLKEYGFSLYSPYTQDEINIMEPQKLN